MSDWITQAANRICALTRQYSPSRLRLLDANDVAAIIEEAHEQSIADAVPLDLGDLLDQAQATQRVAEAALLRSRRGWVNAMELGILPERYHDEAESIVQELTAALAALGSKEAV